MHVRMAPLQALALLLLASLASSAPPSGCRFVLTHIDSKGGFSKAELMRRAAHRSRLRTTTMLSAARHGGGVGSSSSDARPVLRPSSSNQEYLMELAIGTPPVPFVAIADTGSDLVWTQSRPCMRCFPQSTPVYNPAASSSFSAMPCSSSVCTGLENSNCTADSLCTYRYGYADEAYSEGVMGTETLTFRSSTPGRSVVSVAGVAFGAGSDNGGASFNSTGTIGLGRGPLSLVAQLGFGKFSYCLTPYYSEPKLSSSILFGSLAELTTSPPPPAAAAAAPPLPTPLVQSPQNPSWYYVSLEGISLGDTRLPIQKRTLELRRDGTGGMIVDSGSTFTSLEGSAFRVVARHVAAALGQPAAPPNATSLEDMTCYPAVGREQGQLAAMPDMVLHFAGGADTRLPRDSYMGFYEGHHCLTILGSTGMSILGNFQQQNMQMLFDITVGQLSFVPADCSKL